MSLPLRMPTLFTLLLLAAGCSDTIESSALTVDEKNRITQLQNPFGRPLVIFTPEKSVTSMSFGMKNCKVYKASIAEGLITDWTVVIKPDFSLLPQVCDRQTMRIEGDHLVVNTGLISFGAGGCCSATGHYRSTDGVTWERQLDGVWLAMKSSAPTEAEATRKSL